MSAPKVIIQILIVGSQIFGKALFEAGRQAVRNAKHRPVGGASEVAGVSNATTGSITDKLTREHRMTLDEAHLILNLKRGEAMEEVVKNYEHLFAVNSPPAATAETPRPNTRASKTPDHSHYLLSKVVRARERIEAEAKVAEEESPPPDPPTQP
ncbi:hypothetical protein JB92DRAFT_2998364 [Gautieria morchelliformis]|nr:hypothetical protein JB92DRAFT_2998364 [Gautieria morchelliformis]